MKKLISSVAVVAMMAMACTSLDEVNSRLDSLENDVEQLGGDLAALRNAVNSKVSVTSVATIEGGYTINFSDGTSATIKDGKNGENGTDGDAFFKSVIVDGNTVVITLIDDTVIKVPVYSIDFSSISFVPSYTTKSIFVDYFEPAEATFKAEYLITPSSAAAALISGIEKGSYVLTFKPETIRTRSYTGEVSDTLSRESVSVSGSVLTVSFADSTFKYKRNAVALQISNSVNGESICSDFVPVDYYCTALEYGGEKYHTVLMQDGRWWMAENLRYIPNVPGSATEKMTPAKDATTTGINAGIWYPINVNTKTFTDNADTIKLQGYLYNAETAFGVEVGSINETNYDSFEGCRGICPMGWHIPTGAEIYALTGRVASWPGSPTAAEITNKGYTSYNGSPYYEGSATKLGNCTAALLNADGFGIANCGTINCVDKTKTSGTVLNTMSYFLGSSAYTVAMGYKSLMDGTNFKNAQYFSIMYTKSNATANGGTNNYRNGSAVRCIKDKD